MVIWDFAIDELLYFFHAKDNLFQEIVNGFIEFGSFCIYLALHVFSDFLMFTVEDEYVQRKEQFCDSIEIRICSENFLFLVEFFNCGE